MIRHASIRLGLKLLVATLGIGAMGVVNAMEPLEVDLRLLNELNARELFDYSLLHVDRMLQLYPKERDQILVAKARTCYAARKPKDAEAAIAQIAKTSPSYPDAMLLVGESCYRLGKYKEAADAYANYFRKGVVEGRLPDGQDEEAVAEFRRHVSVYKSVLEKVGNLTEAQRVVGLLAGIKGGADERGVAFMQLRTALDIEEAKLDQQKPLDRNSLQKALTALTQLVFIRDGVGALSYVEMARAHVLLGGSRLNDLMTNKELDDKKRKEELAKIRDFIEAVGILKSAGPLLEDIANAQGGADELLAGALFYQGQAYRGQSLLLHFQKKDDKAEPLLKGAAQCFEKVASGFSESRFQSPALAQHAKCSALAESLFGEKIELSEENVDGQLKLQLEQGIALFQRKQYGEAIPVLLKAVQVGRRSKKLPTVVSPLVVAMGHEGYFIEAEALASYLVDLFPKDETTALCVLQLGASLKEAAKKEADPARKAALEDRASSVWEWFVQIAPLNNRAPMVAYAIADHRYTQALALVREAKDAKGAERQEELKTQARAAMTGTIPKFQRVVDQYGTSEYASSALYNLAWCFYETGQRKEAADAFLRYAADDDLEAKYADQRLQAKFRGAECMMLGDQPEESVNQFQELIAWLTPGESRKFDPNSKTAKKLREAAALDIGYAYDLTAELLRDELTALQDALRQNEKASQACQDEIQGYESQLAALAKQSDTVGKEFAATEQEYTGFELDFREAAKRDALAAGEDPGKLAPELREKALANLQTEVARMLEVKEKQAKDNAAGELSNLTSTSEAVTAERKALAERMEGLLQAIAAIRQEFPVAARGADPEGDSVTRLAALADVLQAGIVALDERSRAAQENSAAKQAAQAKNEALIADLEVKQRAFQDRATVLRDDVDAAQTPADKTRLSTERDQAEAALKQTQDGLKTAYGHRAELAQAASDAMAAAATSGAASAATAAEAARLRREALSCVVQSRWLDARLAAMARAMPFGERLVAVLDMPVEERAAQAAALKALGQTVVDAYRAARDARVEVIVQEQAVVGDLLAAAKARLATTTAAVAASQAALVPVQEQFRSWKRKAIDAFEVLLKTPGSDRENLSQALAKVGTTYLELEEFGKAEEALARLAKEYPDSDAGKGALFNLARAQFETGKHAEANATFDRMLADPSSITLANLQYIGRAMLEAGQDGVALKACRELVARSEQTARPDYEEARGIRATSLFRAGLAALHTKQYEQSLKYMETLLKENPKSGYFYEIKFATAEARRNLDPPDLEGAKLDLNDISFSSDMVLKNRADYCLGEMWASSKDEGLVGQGVNRLRLVIDLADPQVPGNLPWIEKAFLAAAKAYARLGRSAERDAMVRSYQERFPQGQFLTEMKNLPPAEFGK